MPVVDINRELCSACNLCLDICPMDVLRTAEGGAPVITYGEDCQSCHLCGRYCPEGAIVLTPYRARPSRLPF